MIKIEDLHANADGKEILKGINLEIREGEIHAIMGPNGSGKSTLSHIIAGKDGYEITKGSITFEGTNLQDINAVERARMGIFLSFQYPVEIAGVNSMTFLKTALNAIRKFRGENELDAMDFLTLIKEKMQLLEMDKSFMKRSVNSGFSGGEKKRFEILQMATLEPKLALLDETDSGLDIDALKVVAAGVNSLRSPKKSMMIITHYQRLLDYIKPDFVHVLAGGKIIKSGDSSLALELEKEGYNDVRASL